MKLGKLFTKIPIIGDMFDDSQDKAMAELAKNRELMMGINTPELNWDTYRPELFNPEMIDFQTISEDPAVRNMQMSALAKMAGLAETGLSEEDALGYTKARQLGAQSARAGTQAAIQDAQNRGVAGSGMEFAMREMANQGGAERSQMAALEQAAQAARQRAMYQQAYTGALSNQREQDFGVNRANTDIINRFNESNTGLRNQAQMMNVDARNKAQLTNSQGRRDVAQQHFNNQVTRAGGVAQANSGMANAYAAQNAANASERAALLGAGAAGVGAYYGGKK